MTALLEQTDTPHNGQAYPEAGKVADSAGSAYSHVTFCLCVFAYL
jgi:hypothetical protein